MSFRVVFLSLAQHEITCTANQHWDEINMKCSLSVRSFFFFFWLLHLWAGHCLKCTRQNQFVRRRTCTCRAPGRLAETTGTRSKWYNRSQRRPGVWAAFGWSGLCRHTRCHSNNGAGVMGPILSTMNTGMKHNRHCSICCVADDARRDLCGRWSGERHQHIIQESSKKIQGMTERPRKIIMNDVFSSLKIDSYINIYIFLNSEFHRLPFRSLMWRIRTTVS